METGYIKFSDIDGSRPVIEVKTVNGTVWMTINEIADLFGVYTPTVNKQLKGIFKDNLLREEEVTKEYRYTCPKGGEYIRIYYNLEVIIFLSFRIQSSYTRAFREWVIQAFSEYSRKDKVHNSLVMYNFGTKECSLQNLN